MKVSLFLDLRTTSIFFPFVPSMDPLARVALGIVGPSLPPQVFLERRSGFSPLGVPAELITRPFSSPCASFITTIPVGDSRGHSKQLCLASPPSFLAAGAFGGVFWPPSPACRLTSNENHTRRVPGPRLGSPFVLIVRFSLRHGILLNFLRLPNSENPPCGFSKQ